MKFSQVVRSMTVLLASLFVLNAYAAVQPNINVTLAGSNTNPLFSPNGVSVFVGMDNNPSNCQYSGVIFQDATLRKDALAIALTARAAGRLVRMDFTGGAGAICIGTAIFLQ